MNRENPKSQNLTELANSEPKISRREFLRRTWVKSAAVAVPAMVLGAHEFAHEKTLAEKGRFETATAFWYPLYERHDQHEQVLAPENIPVNLDALSLEGTAMISAWQEKEEGAGKISYSQVYINEFESPVALLFTHTMEGMDTDPPSVHMRFPTATLEVLKQKHIPVAFGDVKYDDGSFETQMEVKHSSELRAKMGKELLISGAAGLAAGQVIKDMKIDRRGFIRASGLAAFALGVAEYLPAQYRRTIHRKLMEVAQNHDPTLRMWARLHTLSSNLMPEFLNDLFRELIHANKLLMLASSLKEITHKKPSVGYNWHFGHRGIEDWLRLGPEVIRACILAYPDSILQQVIKANNNDTRCLYAIRLVQVPQSLEITQSDELGVRYSVDDTEVADDTIIEDKILAEKLRQRGLI